MTDNELFEAMLNYLKAQPGNDQIQVMIQELEKRLEPPPLGISVSETVTMRERIGG